MNIKIDFREKSLTEECGALLSRDSFSKINIETSNLAVGDIQIGNEGEEKFVVIERKSVADLSSSIKDGRYKEQSTRLASLNTHNHNIVYLIEGSWNSGFHSSTLDIHSLYGSVVSLLFLKGFSVIRTSSVKDTALFICNLARKLEKTNENMFYKTDSSVPVDDHAPVKYENAIKIQKKDNISRDNIGIIMLSQIPGVSVKIADCIIKEFGNINTLISSIETPEGKEKLFGIQYITQKGQTRKINKSTVQKLTHLLAMNEE
tara:strand:- start:5616 stop:6398 length:783 start_codon:yes stop_codon:yes gene_type:complete